MQTQTKMDRKMKLLLWVAPVLAGAVALVGPDGGRMTTTRSGALLITLMGLCALVFLLIAGVVGRLWWDARAEYQGGPAADAGLIPSTQEERVTRKCTYWSRYVMNREPDAIAMMAYHAGYAAAKADFTIKH